MKISLELTDEQTAPFVAALEKLANSLVVAMSEPTHAPALPEPPEAIPADKEPEPEEPDHTECKDGCQYALETGAWPNRVCPPGECQRLHAKPEPAKERREWDACVSDRNGELVHWQTSLETIRVREVLPGDPTPEQVEELVEEAQHIVRRLQYRGVGCGDLVRALKPFAGKEPK